MGKSNFNTYYIKYYIKYNVFIIYRPVSKEIWLDLGKYGVWTHEYNVVTNELIKL